MRYKAGESQKTLWLNETRETRTLNGYIIGAVGAVTWFDEGTPWTVLTVEDLIYNADIQTCIRSRGA